MSLHYISSLGPDVLTTHYESHLSYVEDPKTEQEYQKYWNFGEKN